MKKIITLVSVALLACGSMAIASIVKSKNKVNIDIKLSQTDSLKIDQYIKRKNPKFKMEPHAVSVKLICIKTKSRIKKYDCKALDVETVTK
jgi:hypothetical protein